MTHLKLVIIFKDTAKLGSIKSLFKVADLESNETVSIDAEEYLSNTLVLAGFNDDPAIRRRVMHEVNSRYHNMIETLWEDDE